MTEIKKANQPFNGKPPLGNERVLFDNGEDGIGYLIPFAGFSGQDLVDRVLEGDRYNRGWRVIGNRYYRIIPAEQMPDFFFLQDAEFADYEKTGSHVLIRMERIKNRAHELRRKTRSWEMYPYDFKVGAHIPGEAEPAEAERVKLRAKYAVIQNDIDAATDPLQIKLIMRKLYETRGQNIHQAATPGT